MTVFIWMCRSNVFIKELVTLLYNRIWNLGRIGLHASSWVSGLHVPQRLFGLLWNCVWRFAPWLGWETQVPLSLYHRVTDSIFHDVTLYPRLRSHEGTWVKFLNIWKKWSLSPVNFLYSFSCHIVCFLYPKAWNSIIIKWSRKKWKEIQQKLCLPKCCDKQCWMCLTENLR